MTFEDIKTGDVKEVSELVWHVFNEFEAPEYRQEGIEEFKNFISPKNIITHLKTGQFFIIGCKIDDELIGVIAVRDNSHVSLLFVKKEYHRRGIARKLFNIALKKSCSKDSTLQTITVNSSPYAVKIYERIGFESIDSEQEVNGIRFTPMKFTVIK